MNNYSLVRREFESTFFDQEIFRLEFTSGAQQVDARNGLAELAAERVNVVEVNLGLPQIALAAPLEDFGFRLVDSRITFMTEITAGAPEYLFEPENQDCTLRPFVPADLQRVLELTHQHLTDNPTFVSRYKNETIYGVGSARRWFGSWITDVVQSPDSATCIAVSGGQVVGFFTFNRLADSPDSLPTFKGVLVAVDPAWRGQQLHLAMQAFLFRSFKSASFRIDNTTQLSNYAVIKNHIRSNRNLHCCELSYLWSAAGA